MIEILDNPGSKRLQPKQENAAAPAQQRRWLVVLAAAMLMTLLEGEWKWLARIGWVLLGVVFALDIRHAVYALFFYAAWFHPTGFMAKMMFSLKHFQLAFFMAFTVHAVNGNPVKTFITGFRNNRIFYPVLAILGIGLLNYFRFHQYPQALRTPLNLFLIMTALFYLGGILENFKADSEKILRRGMFFFVAAVTLQIFVALQNTIADTHYFNAPLIHNNHIGILAALSFFYALGLFMAEPKGTLKNLCGVSALVMSAAVIASCSRTAWFSFLFSLVTFLVLSYQHRRAEQSVRVRKRHSLLAVVILGALVVLISKLSFEVGVRVQSLPQLLDGAYWQYTINDFQNFGFLGIFRLLQIYALKDILHSQPLLGVGFTRQVVDFHGFYFCLIGATGFAGLLTFAYFTRQLLNNLLSAIRKPASCPTFFFRVAIFCSFISWLGCCFIETYIVQLEQLLTMLLSAFMEQSQDGRLV